jgi:hypothetical protein
MGVISRETLKLGDFNLKSQEFHKEKLVGFA